MHVLQIHNRYRIAGGEDTVVHQEAALLRAAGHQVRQLFDDNSEIQARGLGAVRAGMHTIWSERGRRLLANELDRDRPDVVHVHNTFPRLSPSIYWQCSAAGVPVVQTLHNYRLTCINSVLLRDSRPCERCVGHSPLSGVRFKCYKGSTLASVAVAAMLVAHRALGTYQTKITAYVALTEFARDLMIRAGLPASRVHVKPNFARPGTVQSNGERTGFVFIGRLSEEKGIKQLLKAWTLSSRSSDLTIVGDGEERESLQLDYESGSRVRFAGWQERPYVDGLLSRSKFLVVSSIWYEVFPMVILEAFRAGVPAIVPNHGALAEIVAHGARGLLYQPGNAASLAAAITRAESMTRDDWNRLSSGADAAVRGPYSASANLQALTRIYDVARASSPTQR